MGRWVSVIVGHAVKIKLYEGKDLLQFTDKPWLTAEYLQDFDRRLLSMDLDEAQKTKQ